MALALTKNDLTVASKKEWLKLDMEFVDRLCDSMPKRLALVIEAKGCSVGYWLGINSKGYKQLVCRVSFQKPATRAHSSDRRKGPNRKSRTAHSSALVRKEKEHTLQISRGKNSTPARSQREV